LSDNTLLTGSRFLREMGLEFYLEANGVVVSTLTPELRYEGPPGHMHGGFSASLLDEAMGAAVWRAGYKVVSVNLVTDFRAPVPIGAAITVRGWVDRIEGGKIHTLGSITLPDGKLAVEGRGLWIEMPEMFKDESQSPFGIPRERKS
jgi:acyl-coenzyme A thioesterase PaaI-like protein